MGVGCEMIGTGSLVNIHDRTHAVTDLFPVLRTFGVCSQECPSMQYSIINCSHIAVHHIPGTYVSYNREEVCAF